MARSRATSFDDPNKIVGFDVEVSFSFQSGKPSVVKHWLGSEAAVRRKARMMANYREVTSIRPVTAAGWLRTYGFGRI